MRPGDYPSESGHDRVEDGDQVLHIPNRPDAAPGPDRPMPEPEPIIIQGKDLPGSPQEGLDDLRAMNARMGDYATGDHDSTDLGGDDPQRLQKEYEWATRPAGQKARDAAHAAVYTAGQLGQGFAQDARDARERLGDIAADASARAKGIGGDGQPGQPALPGGAGPSPSAGGNGKPPGGGQSGGQRFRFYYDGPEDRDSNLQRIFGDDPVTSLGRIHQEVFGQEASEVTRKDPRGPLYDDRAGTGRRSQHLHATSYDGRRMVLSGRTSTPANTRDAMAAGNVGNDYGPSFGNRGREDLVGQWWTNQGGIDDTRPVDTARPGADSHPLVNSVARLPGAQRATTASIQFAVDEGLQRGGMPFTGRTKATSTGRGKNKVTTPADPPGVAHPTNYAPRTLSFTTPPSGP